MSPPSLPQLPQPATCSDPQLLRLIKQLECGLAQRDEEVQTLREHVTNLLERVESMKASTSWRVTEPLRRAGEVARTIKAVLHRSLVRFRSSEWRQSRSGLAQQLIQSGLFDADYYLAQSPDAATSGLDPLAHYLAFGADLKRRPSAAFDPAFYLSWNKDPVAPNVALLADYHATLSRLRAATLDPDWLLQVVQSINVAADTARPPSVTGPLVSILIPVYNQLGFTLNCLRSLLRHQSRYAVEVIVIDDCSSDATPDVLDKLRGVRWLRNTENRGYLRSCNAGAAVANGRYLVLLNNDTCVLHAWLDELIGTFDRIPKVGLVGSQLLYPTGVLQEAGGIIFSDGSGWNYGRNDDRTKVQYNYCRSVDYCSAASVAISADLWRQLGGFDERYAPAYYEDVDLAFRIRAAGRRVVYQPFSRVVHFEGVSCGTDVASGIKQSQLVNAKVFTEHHRTELAKQPWPGTDPDQAKDRAAIGRVLVIDHRTPHPERDAGSLVTIDLMRWLQDLDYLVSFVPDDVIQLPGATDALQRLGIECFYQPAAQSVADHLASHGRRYDAIVVFRAPFLAKHLGSIRRHAPQARLLFHTVDLHSLRLQRQAALTGDFADARRAAKVRAEELSLIQAADCALVISRYEETVLAEALASWQPPANVRWLPFQIKVTANPLPFAQRRDVVFFGHYDHEPNVDAVTYFVRDIFPRITAVDPTIRFLVVGADAPPSLRAVAGEQVQLLGHVPDLIELLQRCRVSVAPLRFGAGIKGKVVTSMSAGLPVVCTTLAAEGMEIRHGEDVLLADDPSAFASAVLQLYQDCGLWQRLSRDGQAYVSRHHGDGMAREKVQDILASMGLAGSKQARAA